MRGWQRAEETLIQWRRAIAGTPPPKIGKKSLAMYWYRGQANFGDRLGPLLAETYSGRDAKWVARRFNGKLLGTGSVLSAAQPGDLVVGSGFIEDSSVAPSGLNVMGVRGPLTAERLGIDPEAVVLGDPGLLAPAVLGVERAPRSRYAAAIVPHFIEAREVREQLHDSLLDEAVWVDVANSPLAVLKAIAESEVCFSSSLHGIVVANALGVPAVWVRSQGKVKGGDFKFRDYFLGSGQQVPESIDWRHVPHYSLSEVHPEYPGKCIARLDELHRVVGEGLA